MAENHRLAVHMKNVSKTFGSGETAVHALKNVTLDTREGELQMIVGPSGCGKTTLLSVIAGTLGFDEGKVQVFNHNLENMTDSQITEFRKKDVGFIFQLFNLIPTLNVIENVSIPLLLNGVDRIEARARSQELLNHVGLKGKERDNPTKLSGGQQQRVAIARALVHNPKLVVCDEPTSALDSETGIAVMKLLKDISRSAGRSVIVVTHDTRIFKYADRIVKMDDGTIMSTEENIDETLLLED